jgi:aminopeptidase YwaD
MSIHLRQKAHNILQKLCLEIPTRQVGSRGNRAAADYVAERLASAGFEVEKPAFDCMDWRQEGAELSVADTSFEVQVSPYSLGSRARASLVIASTLQALERLDAAGKILLLRGELTKEQLMPKNFPFYNPDEHQRIIQTLEDKQPAAIVAATSRNPEVAGALYPFPLIEDGDFHIPSVYMIEAAGEQLAQRAGEQAQLDIRAWRYPARGYNVTARK